MDDVKDDVKLGGYTLEDGLGAVGSGWSSLVTEAFAHLPEGARIVQVKEKFGALRIYFDGSPGARASDKFHAILNDLEARSQTTCEECGAPGRRDPTSPYWIRTSCPAHDRGC